MSIKGAFEYVFHYLHFMRTTPTVILFQLSNGDYFVAKKMYIHDRPDIYVVDIYICIYVTHLLIHVTFMYFIRHICYIPDKLPFFAC